MSVQFIHEDGIRKYAVVPVAEYERLVEAEEMLADVQAYDAAKARADEHLGMDRVRELGARTEDAIADVAVFLRA